MEKKKPIEHVAFGKALFLLWNKYLFDFDALENAITQEYNDVSKEIYSGIRGFSTGDMDKIRVKRARSIITNVYNKILKILD